MKRWICILCALMLLCLYGCGERAPVVNLEQPITAVYAKADTAADHTAVWEDCEYTCYILFTAADNVTDVRLAMLDYVFDEEEMNYALGTVFYEAEKMAVGETLLGGVVFYGDMTTYGISFVDSSGTERNYSLFMSGKDGSLIVEEY